MDSGFGASSLFSDPVGSGLCRCNRSSPTSSVGRITEPDVSAFFSNSVCLGILYSGSSLKGGDKNTVVLEGVSVLKSKDPVVRRRFQFCWSPNGLHYTGTPCNSLCHERCQNYTTALHHCLTSEIHTGKSACSNAGLCESFFVPY